MALPEPITTEADVHAWRALIEAKATAEQQRRCVDWLGRACGRAGVAYVSGPDGERDTLVLIGQQRIGVMVGNMMLAETLVAARDADYRRANPPQPQQRPSRRGKADK
jgi:hypothetical protein